VSWGLAAEIGGKSDPKHGKNFSPDPGGDAKEGGRVLRSEKSFLRFLKKQRVRSKKCL